MTQIATKDGRARNFSFVCYPESLPENWEDVLNSQHFPWACSPLHDQDVEADGSGRVKKAHYHVLLAFEGKKSIQQVQDLIAPLNCPQHVEVVQSVRGMARYLCHLDNPEKHQYPTEQIRTFGGLDVSEFLECTAVQRRKLLAEMTKYVQDNEVAYYDELVSYAIEHRPCDWYPLLTDNSTYFMKEVVYSVHRRMIDEGRFETLCRDRAFKQGRGLHDIP